MSDFEFIANDSEWRFWFDKAIKNLSSQAQDALVEKSAHECRRDLIEVTPSRSGGTRGAWSVAGSRGERKIINSSKVMRFLEYGTPEKSPGAKIFPKHGKVLAIPIIGKGRKTSMSTTVRDPSKRKPGSASKFSFVRWVHGIMPRKIVEKYVPEARRRLLGNVMEALNRL
jgi:hypothetical protein